MARIRRRPADGPPQALPPRDAAGIPSPAAEQPTTIDGMAAPVAPPEVAPTAHQETTIPAETPPPGAPTAEMAPVEELPAGAEPEAVARPGFRERGRIRRRLRYLRRLRELGFRDLGGLVFDLDRFGRSRDDLVRGKLDALAAVDGELRALEAALDDIQEIAELHEPGIAACPRCGTLHGSEARFCPSCGLQLHEARQSGDLSALAVRPQDDPSAGEPGADG